MNLTVVWLSFDSYTPRVMLLYTANVLFFFFNV